jgi:hypothetical protein
MTHPDKPDVTNAEVVKPGAAAFSTSFWSARLWRRAVKSPLLDLLVNLGERPMVKTGLAKLMAQM